MDRTKDMMGDAVVEFSDTACVSVFGQVWSAFQQNSYVARVTYANGRVICVALPDHAAEGRNPQAWTSRAVAAAHRATSPVVFLYE